MGRTDGQTVFLAALPSQSLFIVCAAVLLKLTRHVLNISLYLFYIMYHNSEKSVYDRVNTD